MAQAKAPLTRELPGDVAMWIFILAELLTFGAFFMLFAWMERGDPGTFAQGREQLHPALGLINTIILLSGGALALAGSREPGMRPGSTARARRLYLMAAACGIPFTLIKAWEFGQLMARGLTLSTSSFHFLYFFLCFVHLAHLWLGMALLVLACRRLKSAAPLSGSLSSWQAAASYWHMVDLVWLVLFPLLYLGSVGR